MQVVIDIPDEQIEKSLEESKYINEDEGEKGYVQITMLYTNARLEFVDVERKTDFYSCEYKILPKGHGRLIDADALHHKMSEWLKPQTPDESVMVALDDIAVSTMIEIEEAPTIIEADKAESEDKE